MSKGYKVTLKAVLPANADNPNSILDAMKKMDAAEEALTALGFTNVELTSRYVNNITATAPTAATAAPAAAETSGEPQAA